MDNRTKRLSLSVPALVSTNRKEVAQSDIVGRLEQLEGLFVDGLQQIREIKGELDKRLAGSGTLERLIDAEELALILNVEIKQVYALARNNRIPSLMIGKYRKFNPSHIRKWLDDKSKSDC